MLMGTNQGADEGGWIFMLSPDLARPAWSPPVLLDLGEFISGTGNGTITKTNANFTGRFVLLDDHTDPQLWWEDADRTVKRPVGSCEPCPGIGACGSNMTLVPAAELDRLETLPEFSCGAVGLYNTTGYSSFLYPTLVDPDSPSDNFDEVTRRFRSCAIRIAIGGSHRRVYFRVRWLSTCAKFRLLASR
jgi:hypothetical protein